MATTHPAPHDSSSALTDPTRLLRLALRSNAAFSTACGVVFIADARALAPVIGTPAALLTALGIGLLAFAAALVATSLRRDRARLAREARLHCAADLAWVIGSVPVALSGLLTQAGSIGLAAVSGVVLALAIVQMRGIGATRTAAA